MYELLLVSFSFSFFYQIAHAFQTSNYDPIPQTKKHVKALVKSSSYTNIYIYIYIYIYI
jgi:hypothetical protein